MAEGGHSNQRRRRRRVLRARNGRSGRLAPEGAQPLGAADRRPEPGADGAPEAESVGRRNAGPRRSEQGRKVNDRTWCAARGRGGGGRKRSEVAGGRVPREGAVPTVPNPVLLGRARRGVGGARGRERVGPTRSHPEPGRDPTQRRRVLWGRLHGRRGRRGRPRPPDAGFVGNGSRIGSDQCKRDAGWSSGSSLGS